MVHCVFVDEGTQSIGGFATRLHQYHAILAALGKFELTAAATETRSFAAFLAPHDYEMIRSFPHAS
jgi:hypothetical protein